MNQGTSDCSSAGKRCTPSAEVHHPLGPWPKQTVRVLTDLGLSEAEIAHYFRVDEMVVRRVLRALDRDGGPVRRGRGGTCSRS